VGISFFAVAPTFPCRFLSFMCGAGSYFPKSVWGFANLPFSHTFQFNSGSFCVGQRLFYKNCGEKCKKHNIPAFVYTAQGFFKHWHRPTFFPITYLCLSRASLAPCLWLACAFHVPYLYLTCTLPVAKYRKKRQTSKKSKKAGAVETQVFQGFPPFLFCILA